MARKIASEGVVLLKNDDNVLPLNKLLVKNILSTNCVVNCSLC